MEKWDLFNEKRQSLNKTHYRQDKKIIYEYHIVVDIWTVNTNNEILLTLRHPDKKDYPNFLENTGDSVLAGETSKAGAIRELYEETGIISNESELVFLGNKKEETAFIDNYIIRKNCKIYELTMQEGETVRTQWVTLVNLNEMIKSGIIALPVAERLAPLRKVFVDFLFSK